VLNSPERFASILEANPSCRIGRIPEQLGNFFPTNSGAMLMTAGLLLS
jgi:hypothetical protein